MALVMGGTWVERKMAGCTAPKRGHRTLQSVMACPRCSNDSHTQRQWQKRGIDITKPLLPSPSSTVALGLESWSGKSPKPGFRNIGIDADLGELAVLLRDRQSAHLPIVFEKCTLYCHAPISFASLGRTLSREFGDAPVEFIDCNVYGPLGPGQETVVSGPIRMENCSMRGSVLTLADGASGKGLTLSAEGYSIVGGAVVEDSTFSVGKIAVGAHSGGKLINPRWKPSPSFEAQSSLPVIGISYDYGSTSAAGGPGHEPAVVLRDETDWIVIGDMADVVGSDSQTVLVARDARIPRDIKAGCFLTNRQVSAEDRIPVTNTLAWAMYEDLCGGTIPSQVDKSALVTARLLIKDTA